MKRTTIYLTEKQIKDLSDTFNRLAPNINLSLTQKISIAVEDFVHANREKRIGEILEEAISRGNQLSNLNIKFEDN